ncbi:hypothetical protein ACTWP5_15485 [Streptomyces sp. 4N509B]|uniref:hypothetical protein n=1 Tax=Streptomyces sp. 4N509B TaxID=3457413 RepID=UPI003FCF7FE6
MNVNAPRHAVVIAPGGVLAGSAVACRLAGQGSRSTSLSRDDEQPRPAGAER